MALIYAYLNTYVVNEFIEVENRLIKLEMKILNMSIHVNIQNILIKNFLRQIPKVSMNFFHLFKSIINQN